MEEKLKETINEFYSGKCTDFQKTVNNIRKYYAGILRERGNLKFLSENSEPNLNSFRTIRGEIWGIFLQLGKFDCPDVDELFSSISDKSYHEMLKKIRGETDRIKQAKFDGYSDKEYYIWLTLFSGYVYKISESKDYFSQETYTLGIIFLKNLDMITSYQAFIHFMRPLNNFFLNNKKVRTLCDITEEIISIVDTELYQRLEKSTVGVKQCFNITCFSPIASFFSNLKPIESAELLFDFLLIYGIEFCVYLQASWIILRKDENNNLDIKQESTINCSAVDLILNAIDIYHKLDSDKLNKLQADVHDALFGDQI